MIKKSIVTFFCLVGAHNLGAETSQANQKREPELNQIEALQRSLSERAEFLRSKAEERSTVHLRMNSVDARRESLRDDASRDSLRDDAREAQLERGGAALWKDDQAPTHKSTSMRYGNFRGYLDDFKALFKKSFPYHMLNLSAGWSNFSEAEKKDVLTTLAKQIESETDWVQTNTITYEYANNADGKEIIHMMQDMDELAKLVKKEAKGPSKNKIPTITMRQDKNTYRIKLEVYAADLSGKNTNIPYTFTIILTPAPGLQSTVLALLR